MFERIVKLEEIKEDSLFLWGARQTGKSTLLKQLFPEAKFYDLLDSAECKRLNFDPSLLRQEVSMLPEGSIVVIDEVQKIPELLDEVHWLMVNKDIRFVLCGSSARKLRRCGANLLGGRALREVLFPFVSAEIPDFDIDRAVNNGMLPRHYLVADSRRRQQSYVGDYLQQEIIAEAVVRNLASFTRFMEVAALCDGEIVNYSNIASDCGVSSKTIKEYFSILEETLLGFYLPAYTKVVKRRLVQSPKFYYFDVCIANTLLQRTPLRRGTAEYGHAFEHIVIQELVAYLGYRHSEEKLSYWRTNDARYEVDVVLGDAEVAIEIKATSSVDSTHLRGLKAFGEEHPEAKLMVVSLDMAPRLFNGIEVWPVQQFLKNLWADKVLP